MFNTHKKTHARAMEALDFFGGGKRTAKAQTKSGIRSVFRRLFREIAGNRK